jgi:V/A-type H+/Na+-transporting ATPase subunit D
MEGRAEADRAMAERVPPGRAGRLWLLGRLAFARRSLELLDRKHQLLLRELAGLARRREEAEDRWRHAAAEADRWAIRAAVLGGDADVALAAASVAGLAQVEVPWHNTMGVLHPGDPRCALPELPASEAVAGNGALAPAAAAQRAAIDAGATYAALDRSHRLLHAELRATARRRRGVERRRIPSLASSLHLLELRLEELEREERVVGRWVRQRYASVADRTVVQAPPS